MIPVYLCQDYPYLSQTKDLVERIISQEFEGELELRVASEFWGDTFSIMNDDSFICIIDHKYQYTKSGEDLARWYWKHDNNAYIVLMVPEKTLFDYSFTERYIVTPEDGELRSVLFKNSLRKIYKNIIKRQNITDTE